MVGVAQLVESRIVIPVVVGSSPIVHPIFRVSRPLVCLPDAVGLGVFNPLFQGSISLVIHLKCLKPKV